jgi:hypothetical protein
MVAWLHIVLSAWVMKDVHISCAHHIGQGENNMSRFFVSTKTPSMSMMLTIMEIFMLYLINGMLLKISY